MRVAYGLCDPTAMLPPSPGVEAGPISTTIYSALPPGQTKEIKPHEHESTHPALKATPVPDGRDVRCCRGLDLGRRWSSPRQVRLESARCCRYRLHNRGRLRQALRHQRPTPRLGPDA